MLAICTPESSARAAEAPVCRRPATHVLVDQDDRHVVAVGEVLEGFLHLPHRRLCRTHTCQPAHVQRESSAHERAALSVTTRKFLCFLMSTLPMPASRKPVTVSCARTVLSGCV